ncbi:TonB-dependent copper receptor [Pseudomonas typographi]|uniref:TonB-dependent copper receptor n=1 Tax=Pseudomonas typographi TaxID=2715964 RepID=UPI0016865A0B|nr:TonB-dependent copper receptor [Pseudomonas typographi]MBD1590108.1 TonB-dependent copper receptor [Pseudomonas typographi]
MSRYTAASSTSILLCGALLPPFAQALGNPHHTDEHMLHPTVITAVAPSSPLTVEADPKAPRQPLPASDGADYLKTIPGFAAIRNGGSNGDPVLRGLFGSRLNILTNGGQILGACPGRMDAPTSYISPQTYDRLTVIKGPQSVQWGPGASAGTVLFEREPERFGTLGSRVQASVLAGSRGRLDKTLDAAAGGARGYLRFTGNTSQSDDYRAGHGGHVPSRWYKWNGEVAAGFTPDTDTLLALTVGKGDGLARYAGRGMDGAQFRRETLGLRFERYNLGGALAAVEARLYYNYADHLMDNYSLRRPPVMAMASNPDRRTLGARLKATWQWSDWELVSGLDAQANEHRKRSAMGEGAYRQLPRAKDASFTDYGVFNELTWFADESTRWVAGARVDRAQAQDFRQTLGAGMAAMANPTANQRRTRTLPSGFVRWEHELPNATVYAGVGHVQRFPDYWELFSPKSGPNGSANAFAALKPEKTTQLDTGVHYQGKRLEVWASGYAGLVRDYILFDYTGGACAVRHIDARILGGEFGAAYRLGGHLKADATLAYAWGKNTRDGTPLPQQPPLDTRLGLTYQRETWSAGALWRLASAQHRIDRNAGNVVGRDYQRSAGFGVFSLNGTYRVTEHVTVSTGLDNLFDKRYAEHLNLAGNAGFGYPASDPQATREPGRTLWTKMDMAF